MRLPNNARNRVFALGLTAVLAGCGMIGGGGDRPAVASDDAPVGATMAANGPAADYPMVLGEPYTVDGELFTPADTASYDAVGYATLDRDGGPGISAAHKTLPLPSYVEVTSLDSGKTILVRVERRGPMTGSRLVALSSGAQAQLGSRDGTPVRVRRVNPPEVERADLRAGKAVAKRMETPKTLLAVLQRKLPPQGEASLRSAVAGQAGPMQPQAAPASSVAARAPVQQVAVAPSTANGTARQDFDKAFQPAPAAPETAAATTPRAVTAYPLAPLDTARVTRAPVVAPTPAVTRPAVPAPAAAQATDDGFVVQAAAFSSKANAERAATRLGGFVMQSGKFYRVRTGPYTSRGQAEAALAKVRAAGYSDARVFTAG